MTRNLMIIVMMLLLHSCVSHDKIRTVTLRNDDMQVTVLNYGARVQSLQYRNQDVVLGFDTLIHYSQKKQNFGAVVGRYIGRILGGNLNIDGKHYTLQTGGNGDCSHGGTPSFSQRYWKFIAHTDSSITLRYVSPDGENGFPGKLTLDVRYTLLGDALRIDYTARTSAPTALNPSNHSFFNLTGNLGSDVLGELLWINSDSIALYDENKRVTGEMGCIAGTPLDFRSGRSIGERINEPYKQLLITKGYDHCYQLNSGSSLTVPAAILYDTSTKLSMTVFTTEPAMQIYTVNSHNGSIVGKGGLSYPRNNAICFETMHFPDSPNKPQWPSTILRPGETFRSTTVFTFSHCASAPFPH